MSDGERSFLIKRVMHWLRIWRLRIPWHYHRTHKNDWCGMPLVTVMNSCAYLIVVPDIVDVLWINVWRVCILNNTLISSVLSAFWHIYSYSTVASTYQIDSNTCDISSLHLTDTPPPLTSLTTWPQQVMYTCRRRCHLTWHHFLLDVGWPLTVDGTSCHFFPLLAFGAPVLYYNYLEKIMCHVFPCKHV